LDHAVRAREQADLRDDHLSDLSRRGHALARCAARWIRRCATSNIVVDDASTDSSWDIIRQAADTRSPVLRAIRKQAELRQADRMNRAIALCARTRSPCSTPTIGITATGCRARHAGRGQTGRHGARTTSFSMTPARQDHRSAWPTGQTDWDLSFDDFLIGSNAYRTFNLGMLNYRKFSWFNTHFSFAGVQQISHGRASAATITAPDSRPQVGLHGDTSTVSGSVKAIRTPPSLQLPRTRRRCEFLARKCPCAPTEDSCYEEDWTRWNDYGIGLSWQGDFEAAAAAFEKITEADPQNPDGWTNIGRVLVAGGRYAARESAGRNPWRSTRGWHRTNFFTHAPSRKDGDYDRRDDSLCGPVLAPILAATASCTTSLAAFFFFQKRYAERLRNSDRRFRSIPRIAKRTTT